MLVSLPTSEGGKAGVFTEAPRTIAAKLIAEGRARVAMPAEAREFRDGLRAGQEQFQQEEAARRVQVVVVPASQAKKPAKDRS